MKFKIGMAAIALAILAAIVPQDRRGSLADVIASAIGDDPEGFVAEVFQEFQSSAE